MSKNDFFQQSTDNHTTQTIFSNSKFEVNFIALITYYDLGSSKRMPVEWHDYKADRTDFCSVSPNLNFKPLLVAPRNSYGVCTRTREMMDTIA